jgi:hypothetical protein
MKAVIDGEVSYSLFWCNNEYAQTKSSVKCHKKLDGGQKNDELEN